MRIKTSNGTRKVIISKSEWEAIGNRAGWGGGPHAAGPGGECECPHCGCKTPHEDGMPCRQCECPECGKMMARDLEEETEKGEEDAES